MRAEVATRWVSALVLAGALVAGVPAAAQDWHGRVGMAYAWHNVDGSETSFRSQNDFREGFVLDDLVLERLASDDGGMELRLDAWGFGGADPVRHASLGLQLADHWSVDLSYDRRQSFFALDDPDWSRRRDAWHISRWRGGVTYDGWDAVRVGVRAYRVERTGQIQRAVWGLNQIYQANIDLDESMTEGLVFIETRNLPVRLHFEQAIATYERENAYTPARPDSILGPSGNLYTGAERTIEEEVEVPTTRFTATFAGESVELAAAVLWSPAELEASGAGWNEFAIGGGRIGSVQYIDTILGSADMDTLAGNVRLGIAVAGPVRLRLEGSYRDRSTDSSLLGERIVRMLSPTGTAVDIGAPLDTTGIFDTTDAYGRAELEWRESTWSVWAGGFAGSREVEWQLTDGADRYAAERESSGLVAGAAWSPSRDFSGSVELERGTFDDYVFRTDPESVDRTTLKLRTSVGSGVELQLNGRVSRADNPSEASGLDYSSDAYGAGVVWTSADGATSTGMTVDLVSLSSSNGIVLPSGAADTSRYDLDLDTWSMWVSHRDERFSAAAALTRATDRGDTWPLESLHASGRVGYEVAAGWELALFGQHWSYDESEADRDDFDVTRYGVAVTWSF